MTAPVTCACRCHGDSAVRCTDPLEAAVACAACKGRHAAALLNDVLTDADYGPPQPWTPPIDNEGRE